MNYGYLFLVLMIGCLLQPAPVEASDVPPPLPRLMVVDGKIVRSSDQKPVTLRGVSLCSLGWIAATKTLQSLHDNNWPANIVRLPVQRSVWEKMGAEAYFRVRLDPAVKQCKAQGLYCIIDWHLIERWNTPETDKLMHDFWRVVAPRYADETHILYELFNEPTEPSPRTHENWLQWRSAAQPWVDRVQKLAPHTPLLIGGPHWSQMPHFAVTSPLAGKNLVYTAHIYPQFKPPSWNRLFGDASEHIPIFLSEWGWSSHESEQKHLYYSTAEAFGTPLKTFVDQRPNIHWTAWSYDTLCGPAMTGKDADMGKFVQDWLIEKSN